MSQDLDLGLEIQRRLALAERYNRWIFDTIKPHLGQRLIETGAAIGNMTRLFAPGREIVAAVDINPKYLGIAREKWDGPQNVEFMVCDVTSPELRSLKRFNPDTIICLNLLEHLEDEIPALENFKAVLTPGGLLVVMVPALPCIYGAMDRADHHFRRYAIRGLKDLLQSAGFEVESARFFNFFGVFAWFFNGRVLKHTVVHEKNVLMYEKLVPFFRFAGKLPWPLGQSIICICRRTATP